MISSLTVSKDFEELTWGFGDCKLTDRTRGYKLFCLSLGTRLNTESQLVVLIGSNGSGKSTLLEKLHAQLTIVPDRIKEWPNYASCPVYFELEYRGRQPRVMLVQRCGLDMPVKEWVNRRREININALSIFEEERKAAGCRSLSTFEVGEFIEDIEETVLAEETTTCDYLGRASTGQMQSFKTLEALRLVNKNVVLCFDEPTLGLDLLNIRRVIKAFEVYLKQDPERQIFVATHELAFCRIPGARIISLYESPARSYSSNNFNPDSYFDAIEAKE